jgi:hypothetical protein
MGRRYAQHWHKHLDSKLAYPLNNPLNDCECVATQACVPSMHYCARLTAVLTVLIQLCHGLVKLLGIELLCNHGRAL